MMIVRKRYGTENVFIIFGEKLSGRERGILSYIPDTAWRYHSIINCSQSEGNNFLLHHICDQALVCYKCEYDILFNFMSMGSLELPLIVCKPQSHRHHTDTTPTNLPTINQIKDYMITPKRSLLSLESVQHCDWVLLT